LGVNSAFYPFRPYAEYTWCAPFWMRAVFIPPPADSRDEALSRLAASLGKAHIKCVRQWNTEDLRKNSAEPYRLQRQRGHRLIAELEPEVYLLNHITSNLPERHSGIEVRAISTRLYIEEYGLGAFEAIFALSGDPSDEPGWAAFLTDREFWNKMDFYTTTLEGKLSVQKCWRDLRKALSHAIQESELTPFPELEHALEGIVGQEIMEENDFLWTQCMDIILFWNQNIELTSENIRKVSPILHEIGLATDYTTNTERSEVDSSHVESLSVRTIAYAIATGDNMFVSMYSGFGMVALVFEPHPWHDGTAADIFEISTSPSRKITALRRTLLLNYGAMTTATNALKQFLIKSLTTSGRAATIELHENLRRIIVALSVIKHEARRELIESDDIETYAYKALYEAWNLPSQIDLLSEMINDADKAASRLSESNIHEEDRTFTLILILLTLVTIGGIASEVIGFIGRPEELNASLEDGAKRLGLLFGVLFVIAALAFWVGRRLLHSHRRFARARKR
jgi:ABC-type multidrug transport system fused ATPase/permease subunit